MCNHRNCSNRLRGGAFPLCVHVFFRVLSAYLNSQSVIFLTNESQPEPPTLPDSPNKSPSSTIGQSCRSLKTALAGWVNSEAHQWEKTFWLELLEPLLKLLLEVTRAENKDWDHHREGHVKIDGNQSQSLPAPLFPKLSISACQTEMLLQSFFRLKLACTSVLRILKHLSSVQIRHKRSKNKTRQKCL